MFLEKKIQEVILNYFELFPTDLASLITDFIVGPPEEEEGLPAFSKSTSFISKRKWRDILTISADRLTQLGCECEFQNYSLKCIFYNEQRCVNIPFRVNVFTSTDLDNAYVVKIQNCSPENVFEFWELLEHFVNQEGGLIHQKKIKSGSLMSSSDTDFRPIVLTDTSLDYFLSCLKSADYKVRLTGITILAQCGQTKANCLLLRRSPLIVPFLCSFLDISGNIIYPTLILLKFLLNGFGGAEEKILSQLDISKIHSLLNQKLGKTITDLIKVILQAGMNVNGGKK